MSIRYHPRPEYLLSYAAGTLAEGASVLIAGHLTLCPDCRATVGRMESVGGALLDDLPDGSVDEKKLSHMMTRLDEPGRESPGLQTVTATSSQDTAILPAVLLPYLGQRDPDRLTWRRMLNFEYIDIETAGDGQARLLRAPPGLKLPFHSHTGDELVLVLAGGYSDGTGVYWRGDVASADADLRHQPSAAAGATCICLTVNYGWIFPTRLLAPLAKLFKTRLN